MGFKNMVFIFLIFQLNGMISAWQDSLQMKLCSHVESYSIFFLCVTGLCVLNDC